MMNENERLKMVQVALGFSSQEKFASALGKKQGSLSDIYRMKSNVGVSDSIKRVLENDYSVNIEWLETGEGGMFKHSPQNEDPTIFGEDYILEVKDGQKCHSLPVKDDIMFTSMGYGLKKGSSFPWATDFEILYGKLSAGQYRIIKEIRIEPQQETPKEYFISAEFSI